jgi:hypothetical protein
LPITHPIETIAGKLAAVTDAGGTEVEALLDRDVRRVQVSTVDDCNARTLLSSGHTTVEGRLVVSLIASDLLVPGMSPGLLARTGW